MGVYLSEECFAHGQLYVAASRVGLPSNIRFAIERDEDLSSLPVQNAEWWAQDLSGVPAQGSGLGLILIQTKSNLTSFDVELRNQLLLYGVRNRDS